MNPWLIDGAAVWAISVLRFPTGGRFNRAGQAPPVSRRHFRHLNRVSRGESHMRRLFSRVLAVLAITAVAALGADNSIGTWKVNVAKSKYTPAPFPLKSLTSVREAVPGSPPTCPTKACVESEPEAATSRRARSLITRSPA